MPRGWPSRMRPRDADGNVLRVDEDAICPKCLRFVGPRDIVRRTVYGVVQHEHCPQPAPMSAEPESDAEQERSV